MLKREETPYFRECQKLGGVIQKDIYLSPTKAATYLYLLNHCDRGTALQFAKRRICKWDTTIEQDGPACCRILVPEQKREVHYDIIKKCINGWQNIGYEVFYQNKDTIADQKQLNLDYENDKIQTQLEVNEQKLTNDVKFKMKNLAKFYDELNKKYRLKVSDPDFKEQLHQAKELLHRQRNKPLQYFKKNGVKFVELLHELKLADQRSNTLLDRFRAFNQLKASQFRIKEKLPERLYNKTQVEDDGTPSNNKNKLYAMKRSFKQLTMRNLNQDDSVKSKFQGKEKSYHMSKQFDNTSLNLIQFHSQTSFSQHKKARTQFDSEEYFEQQLGKFANKMIEYHPQSLDVRTENIIKLQEVQSINMQNKQNLKQLCLKKISKLQTQSQHRSKTERQETNNGLFTSRSRDKDSTKASIIFKRSQLLTSFTNKSDYVK